MTTPRVLHLGVALALGLSGLAEAGVNLAENGHGQALLYPIFSADDGWSSLFSVTNTTNQRKAIKVIVREARVGQEVLNFNLYLDARDTWTGSIYDAEGDNSGPASLTTWDSSCTVPDIYNSNNLPVGPAGNSYVEFRTFELDDGREQAFDFQNFDTETRSGFIEVVDMANVVGDSAELIDDAECLSLNNSWVSGPWSLDPLTDTSASNGGLVGQMTLINAASAQAMSASAVAIDGLFSQPQHTSPGIAVPSLAVGAFLEGAQTTSTVMYENEALTTTWDQPIDAINAVLSHASLRNGFTANDTVATEWVVTFPTRPSTLVPVHNEGIGNIAPFTEAYGEVDIGKACEMEIYCGDPFPPTGLYDDVGELIHPSSDICFPIPGPQSRNLCTAVTRLRIGENAVLGGGFVEQIGTSVDATGWLDLSLLTKQARTNLETNPNSEAHVYHGLPAIGFQLNALRTDSIISSTLSNFASMQSHSGTRMVCTEACD